MSSSYCDIGFWRKTTFLTVSFALFGAKMGIFRNKINILWQKTVEWE